MIKLINEHLFHNVVTPKADDKRGEYIETFFKTLSGRPIGIVTSETEDYNEHNTSFRS